MQGRDGDDGRFEDDLGRALRRSEAEARPREEFARGLRERFVEGGLDPRPEPAPEPAPVPARVLPLPRWVSYPAAAALLAAAFALSGALDPRTAPEPPVPHPPRLSALDVALTAAERRIQAAPGLAGRSWQRRVVEGRPWLLPAEAAFADAGEMKALSLYMAEGAAILASEFPGLVRRAAVPTVAVVAPSRQAFEVLVAPKVAPAPLGEFTIAFHLPELSVLLVSPNALDPGGPPCEEMDVVHEAVHAWLHARRDRDAALPLWVDEGLAGAISQAGLDPKKWCRSVLAATREYGMDPFTPEDVLGYRDYGTMARRVAERAPCDERPYSLMPVFYAHAESLVLFLQQDHPGCVHRVAFQGWLEGALEGKESSPEETAKALGFASVEALFRARDEWLER